MRQLAWGGKMNVYMGYAVLIAVMVVGISFSCAAVACAFGITNKGVPEPGRSLQWIILGTALVALLLNFGVQQNYIDGVALSELLHKLI